MQHGYVQVDDLEIEAILTMSEAEGLAIKGGGMKEDVW